jgi:Transposase
VNSEKYIGLDVHQATICVAVMDPKGKVVMESILETKATTILEFLAGLRGTLSVTFEEGTWAAWLYDLLKPHVANLVVCNPRKNALLKHGNKTDKIDARKLADLLRLNDLEPVYHGETGVRMLRELARSYLTIVKDVSRVMSRLKAIYRSWAIPCAGRDVYYTRHRGEWLGKSPRLAPVAAPSNSISNWICCSPCASKPGANCWRRVASIPSLPNCGRSPPWARFALLWRWL